MTKTIAIFLSMASMAAGDAALAQTTGSGQAADVPVTDIIVTANRREQKLQDVPLAVTALGGEALRSQGIASVADLGAGRVPGLAINSLFGSQSSVMVNFRGLGSTDPSQGTQDSPAAFYIDGINLPRAQGLAMELVTPERIEVLRGPQGQLFGRNAEAGAIQIISKRPTGRWEMDASGGVGNYKLFYGKARLDLPEIAGFRIQLSGFGRDHGGYVKNLPNPLLQGIQPIQDPRSSIAQRYGDYDSDFGMLRSYGGRVAVERDFGDLNIFYAYDNTYSRETGMYGGFLQSPDVGTYNNPTGYFGPDRLFTQAGTGDGTRGLRIFTQQPFDPDHYPSVAAYSNFVPYFVTRSSGHTLNLTLPVNDGLTVKSITGLRRTIRNGSGANNLGVSPVNPASPEYVNSRMFSQELQLVYTGSRLDVTGGLIYFYEKVIDQRDAWFAVNCGILGTIVTACTPSGDPTRAPYYSPLTGGQSGFKDQSSVTNSYAAYAQATYTPPILDDRLELTAGLRYSNDTKRGQRTVTNGQLLATPLDNVAKTDRVDPAFTVKYKFSPDINIYARYAVGFRDGGANVRSNIFNAYAAEELKSIELGLKSQLFDRRVTLNLAAFRNTLINGVLNNQSDPANNPGLTDSFNNPSHLITKGIEVELSARPVRNLTLSANYTFLDVDNLAPIGIDQTSLSAFVPGYSFSPTTGIVPDAATLAAHPRSAIFLVAPVGAPRHSGSIGADYTAPFVDDTTLAFHIDWQASTRQYTSAVRYVTTVVNGVATPRPSYMSGIDYSSVNGRITWQGLPLGGLQADLSLWGKNILNRVNPSFSFPAGNPLSAAQPAAQSALFYGAPATYGVELRVRL